MKTAEETYMKVQDTECPRVNNLTLPDEWQIRAMKEYARQVAEKTLNNLASFKMGGEYMFTESQQAYIRGANIKLP